MGFTATLNLSIPVSAGGHSERDRIGAKSASDLYNIPLLSAELEKSCANAQQKLESLAKKAGLKPKGRPDLNYGFHGGADGSIDMWFQIQAEQ